MSTSPTLISWRRKSSAKRDSFANSTSERSLKKNFAPHANQTWTWQVRFFAAETSKTGKGPWSKGKEDRRRGGKYSFQTFRSTFFLCSVADPVRPPVPHWKDCSRPGSFPSRVAECKPGLGDSPGIEIRSIPS